MRFELPTPVARGSAGELVDTLLLNGSSIRAVVPIIAAGAVVAVDVDASSEQFGALEDLVRRSAADFQDADSRIEPVTVASHAGNPCSTEDPHGRLAAEGLSAVGDGLYVFEGDALDAMQALEAFVGAWFRKKGCTEQAYPSLLDSEPLFALNYFETMGHHIYYPVSLVGKYEVINEFAGRNRRDTNLGKQLDLRPRDCAVPTRIVSPTVCFHCFRALSNKTVPLGGGAFTGKNLCAREERSGVRGLERLQSFTMREAVVIGPPARVEQVFEEFVGELQDLFAQTWDLRFRIRTANDPFFGAAGSRLRVYQSAYNLKLELQVYLPYCQRYIACGSLNKHQDSILRAFQIGTQDADAQSMCFGIGYERLLLALLAQTGLSARALASRIARTMIPA